MAPVDTSFYPTQQVQPFNALQTTGEYQNIANSIQQNRILQQQAAQAQIETQIAQGNQRVGQIIAKNTGPDGNTRWLDVQSDAAKDPLTSHPAVFGHVQNLVNNQLEATPAGINPTNNAPVSESRQQLNLKLGGGGQQTNGNNSQQPASPTAANETPTIQTGLAPGVVENVAVRQKHYNDIQEAANSVPQENAALNNILNISKSGVPSGSMVGRMYKALGSVSPSLFPESIGDPAAQLKLIQSHAAQIALAGGMPGSDARLVALESAKVGDQDLPKVIQTMVPYLLAVNNGKLAQAKYYRKVAGNGTNPDQVLQAQSNWTQNFDPRLLEMTQLMSNPEELQSYVKGLSKEDKTELLKKYNASKQLGIIE